MKLYVASSWRNDRYDGVVRQLEAYGYKVWNWRKPPTGGSGFKWSDCGLETYAHGDKIGAHQWDNLLRTQPAQAGFASDLAGMNWCEAGVLLHPCGRSAHLEAGWIAGRGKIVHVLALEPVEPDLMVLALGGQIFGDIDGLLNWLWLARK